MSFTRILIALLLGIALGLAGQLSYRYYDLGQVKYEAGECLTDAELTVVRINEVTEETYKFTACAFIFCGDDELPHRELNEKVEFFYKMDCDTGVILGEPRY